MKVTIDDYASYVYLVDDIQPGSVSHTVPVGDDVYIDYDIDGRILGIEFLGQLKVVDNRNKNGK